MRKLLKIPTLDVPRRQGGSAQPRDKHGPVFHESWQAHIFAITMALYEDGHYTWAECDSYLGHEIRAPGHYRQDADAEDWSAEETPGNGGTEPARSNYSRWRAACEADGADYYNRWLDSAEKLLLDKGLIDKDEFSERLAALTEIENTPPRFVAGDSVMVRDAEPTGHTHLPLYLLGKTGTVEKDRGVFVFPEAGEHGHEPSLQHVYTVRFVARDVWGNDGSELHNLNFSLWDYQLAEPGP
jgi:nitrile hydratase